MWLRAFGLSSIRSARAICSPQVLNPIIIERKIARDVAPTLLEINRRKRKEKRPPNPRNTYLEWNTDAELYAFGKRLNEDFDPELLQMAFTHRSYIIQEERRQKNVGIEEPALKLFDNQVFIQEGEAFIFNYVDAYLRMILPKFPEEGISAVRNYLTSTEILSKISFNLGTKDIILSDEFPVSDETLANTFKAIVTALAKSSGIEKAAHFVRDFVITMLNGVDINELWVIENPTELLQQLFEKSGKVIEPRLIGQLGKNTVLAAYRVGIYVDKEMYCFGFGESIDIAAEMAAREALKKLFGTKENMAPFNFKIDIIPKECSEKMQLLCS